MMELSSKSRIIKKKHKKKKIRVTESVLAPLIKPEVPSGESNWIRLQKIVGPITRESSKKDMERNMNIIGIGQSSKDYKPPFSRESSFNAKIPTQSSTNREMQTAAKCDVEERCSSIKNNSAVTHEHSKITCNGDQNHPFEFNFNKSTHNSPAKTKSGPEAQKNEVPIRKDDKKLTKAVAMDCEMVGTGPKGDDSIIARVSIVNSYGDCLYDEFVKPKERVTDFRTKVSGVRPSDLKNGKNLYEVQREVLSIIEGRVLVGHSIRHDLDVLFISHPRHLIRDTAFYKPFREISGGKTPSLKTLASKILGCNIQNGEHSSVEDAQAAMLLYLRQRREWETFLKSQKRRKPKMIENQIKT